MMLNEESMVIKQLAITSQVCSSTAPTIGRRGARVGEGEREIEGLPKRALPKSGPCRSPPPVDALPKCFTEGVPPGAIHNRTLSHTNPLGGMGGTLRRLSPQTTVNDNHLCFNQARPRVPETKEQVAATVPAWPASDPATWSNERIIREVNN